MLCGLKGFVIACVTFPNILRAEGPRCAGSGEKNKRRVVTSIQTEEVFSEDGDRMPDAAPGPPDTPKRGSDEVDRPRASRSCSENSMSVGVESSFEQTRAQDSCFLAAFNREIQADEEQGLKAKK